jgi:uncharacterized protein (TIGR03437 family)
MWRFLSAGLGFAFCSIAAGANAQLTCDATAEPAQVRAEGLSERLGAIVLTCQALSGDTVNGFSLSLVVSAPVTNRLTGDTANDVVLTADTATGRVPVGGAPRLIGDNVLAFEQFSFPLPADGRTAFRITNVRAALNRSHVDSHVTIFMTTNQTAFGIRNNPVTVGIVRRGLLANSSSTQVVCTGSPLPEEITFSRLVLRGTRFFTLRVTEGNPDAFVERQPATTNGVRVLVRYTGFPAGARLFVPNVIAGSSALSPTSAGDLGLNASGGMYMPVTGGLVLSRVPFADATGSGDTPLFTPPVAPVTLGFNDVSEVALRSGSGFAVYEVVSANPNLLESAHLPTFLGLSAQNDGRNAVARASVTLAPLSTVTRASADAPVPRFTDVAPGLDCDVLRDCNADYFPRLLVEAPALQFRVPARTAGFWSKYIRVLNESGGLMNWATRIDYQSGSGWLRAFPESGVGTASLNLHAQPENLAPGYYEATFTVDAGPLAGSRSFRVQLEVFAATPPPPTPPLVRETGNAANLRVDRLVPGSLATLKGERLGGADLRVTFDGIPAIVFFSSDTQINLLVPPELAGRPVAQLQVTSGGVTNVGQIVQLGAAAPAIFTRGVLNQDGFPNSPDNPEVVGRVFQVFATGLPVSGRGRITAKIHDREIDAPLYAGPAPGLTGVQQVNFFIPADLPAMTSEILVCGAPENDPARKVCSPPYEVVLRRID